MLLLEKFTILLQDKLGNDYVVMANEAFSRDFTTPSQTPYGLAYDINYQAFEEHRNKIIAVLQMTPLNLTSTKIYTRQAQYTLSFWCPIDTIKRTADGTFLEQPIDFYGDIETLIGEFSEAIYIDNNTNKLYATMSEPSLTSAATDQSGSGRRAIYQVSGAVSLADKKLATGADTKVCLMFSGVEHYFDEITELTINSTTDSNLNTEQGQLYGNQSPSLSNYSVSFTIPDYVVTTNQAFAAIEKKAYENAEVLTAGQSAKKSRMVLVRLYRKNVKMKEFWAVLSVIYGAPGKAAYGTFAVTLVDSGEAV